MKSQVLEKQNIISILNEDVKLLRKDRENVLKLINDSVKELENVKKETLQIQERNAQIDIDFSKRESNIVGLEYSYSQKLANIRLREAKLLSDEEKMAKMSNELESKSRSTLKHLEALEHDMDIKIACGQEILDDMADQELELKAIKDNLLSEISRLNTKFESIKEKVEESEVNYNVNLTQLNHGITQARTALRLVNEELEEKMLLSVDVTAALDRREEEITTREQNLKILISRLQKQIQEFRPDIIIKV